MIPCQRDAFDIPDDIACFNCAYMAPMLKVVRKAAGAAIARTSQPWLVTSDEQLRQQKIFVSIRGQMMRIAPHLLTRPADVDRLLGALRQRG
jgi:hypothetical protein